MKRLALCTTAALLALAGSTRPAAASGYLVCWGRTQPAPAVQTAERASSGYMVSWNRSGYMVSWGKAQPAE